MTVAVAPRRIAVVGSASGVGKTTLARTLASRLGARFIEFDALQHGPNWVLASDAELRAQLEPIIACDAWVIDVLAERVVGTLILDAAELVVWLDLPPWVWLPRLLVRSTRRWFSKDALWNGNRETLAGIFWEKDGLLPHAFRAYFCRRGTMAARLNGYVAHSGKRIIRLCTVAEVAAFLAAFPG